jgi:surface polysaccharide O-acyltransferase-like enzyme
LTGSHILVPFWFIPMITIFYLLAPALLWIDRDGRLYFLLPLLLGVTVFIHRPSNLDNILQSCAYFLPVYIYGMWFSHYRDRVMEWHRRWLPALVIFVAALVWVELTYLPQPGFILSASMFSTENGIVGTNALQKLVLCGVLLVTLRRFGAVLDNKLSHLAHVSLAIYFFHMFGIYFLKAIALDGRVSQITSLWHYWLAVAAVVAFCVGGLWLAKQTRGMIYRFNRFCQLATANLQPQRTRSNVFP